MHMKSGLKRRVAFGGRGNIREVLLHKLKHFLIRFLSISL